MFPLPFVDQKNLSGDDPLVDGAWAVETEWRRLGAEGPLGSPPFR